MALSLYDATIPAYLQVLGAIAGLLDKAEAFCAERQLPQQKVIDARLAEDMLPFGYQVKSTVVHSIGAIEGVRKGSFSPDKAPWPDSIAGLRARVEQARAALAALDPAEVNAFEGRDMRFEMGSFRLEFTAENFLLSFSQPNFYFHATTAYGLLRSLGLRIGKQDFMGRMRVKG
jgi:hypothetical protein